MSLALFVVSLATAGAALAEPPVTADPLLSFAAQNVDTGTPETLASVVTNTSGGPVAVTAVNRSGDADFSLLAGGLDDCTTKLFLTPGDTCRVRVSFDAAATGTRSGSVAVEIDGATATTIALTGSGTEPQLSSQPGALSFRRDIDEGAMTLESTIMNSGTEAITLASVRVSGADAGDFAQTTGEPDDCTPGQQLVINATCKVRVRFDPATTGTKTGTVTVSAAGVPDAVVALTGSGIQTDLTRGPNLLAFGSRNVAAGPSFPRQTLVTNTGTEPIAVSSVYILDPSAARFFLIAGEPGDCVSGLTLRAGETCAVRVSFDPQTRGPKLASITLATSAGPDIVIPLRGTGTPAPRLTVAPVRAAAAKTANRRLEVRVAPAGGKISAIVVQIRSAHGQLLGVGKLRSALKKKSVTVKLRKRLARGRYRATASGRDAFGNRVSSPAMEFRLR